MDNEGLIARNLPLPAGLTVVGYIFMEGYDLPIPDGVMVCWVTQQIIGE